MDSEFDLRISECVGCGWCCIKTQCGVSLRLHGKQNRCPELIWSIDENRYFCRLMTFETSLSDAYKKELYAGEGCCASLNSWRRDIRNRDEAKEENFALDTVLQIFVASLGREFISSNVILFALISTEAELKERGYTPEQAKVAVNQVMHIFNQNRSAMANSFMG